MSTLPIEQLHDFHRTEYSSEPLVFHCNHYNVFLQHSICLAKDYLPSETFLVGAAAEVAFNQLSATFASEGISDTAARIACAQETFSCLGFGVLDLSPLSATGGTIGQRIGHYSHAWQAKFGDTTDEIAFFDRGWLAGAASAIFGTALGSFAAHTQATGTGNTGYVLSVVDSPDYDLFEKTAGMGTLTVPQSSQLTNHNVDFAGIYGALTGMAIVGNDDGLIPAFGVYLTRHYANYYNRISYEFETRLLAQMGDECQEISESLLVEAGHVCAFNTFGGIMTSPEWDALIKPSLQDKNDWVHGMCAAVNALGWGLWTVTKLSDNEAIFEIFNDYESVGYEAAYGTSKHCISYLAIGAAIGIMDLVHVGDVESKPAFTPEFYDNLFKSENSFSHEVLSSRSMGDASTTIRVYR